jgi:hypothetical protein
MPTRRFLSTGVATAVAAGLIALNAPSASATDTPSCEQAGSTTQRNIYYYNCELFVTGNPYITWSGAPITSGQGTGELWGTCIGGSLPYTITARWTIAGTAYSSSTHLTCSGAR